MPGLKPLDLAFFNRFTTPANTSPSLGLKVICENHLTLMHLGLHQFVYRARLAPGVSPNLTAMAASMLGVTVLRLSYQLCS